MAVTGSGRRWSSLIADVSSRGVGELVPDLCQDHRSCGVLAGRGVAVVRICALTGHRSLASWRTCVRSRPRPGRRRCRSCTARDAGLAILSTSALGMTRPKWRRSRPRRGSVWRVGSKSWTSSRRAGHVRAGAVGDRVVVCGVPVGRVVPRLRRGRLHRGHRRR